MFTYALARISSIGVFPEQAATRQRDVRLVNSCSAVMLLIAAANMTVDGIADIWQFVLFDAAAIFMSALPLLLNKLQQYGTARWTLLFVSQLAAFTTPTLPGPAAHGEVIFASSLVLTMVVLHRHSRYALFSMTLFSVAGYALLQIYGHHLPPVQLSEAQVIYARVSLTLSSFALIVFLLHAALTLSRSLEEEIAEKSREIDEARKQAESALLVRSQFVSSMNHEIRTPLNGIIGLAHRLSRENLGITAQELVHLLRRSADTLFALINNALDLGRLEAGRADLEVLPFECKDLAGNLEAALAVPAVQKGNRFRVLVDPRIPRLTGDPTRISQVLTNLAANAIKFTKMGQVTVRIVLVQRDENSACVSFAVRDTGIGMAAAELAVIFEPYAQANRQIRSSYGGTGLGLAITRSILKLLNSELLVASTPGRGTEFSFTLNLPVAQAAEQKPRIGSISMPALRVLIAEDNDINSIVLERILQSWAVKFQFARDGKEALQAAREREFDLVLMDVQMPVLDGIEATRQLRQLNTALPVYGITADTSEATVESALSAGMNGVLPKPFRQDQLLSILEGIHSKKNQNRENG
jgi:signal transduction histidine kinase/CheY-like chemotaxis protein